jgi:scyllo-inositol 2-dehydrogenase (NAD+)
MTEPVKLGIVGLGRWAKVLTRAGQKSNKFKIVAGYSRSEEKRQEFQDEFGIPSQPDMQTLLSDPEMKGVILTVPNEHHLPVADEVAKAGKYVYTEKTIANTLHNGLAMEALQ